LQQVVADIVPVLVVDLLETIEVEAGDAGRTPRRHVGKFVDTLSEQQPVG
jgi:hypothetical protein